MSLLTRKRIVLAKIETVYGTDAAPLGANAILVRNLNMNPLQGTLVQRDLIRPYFGNSDVLVAETQVQIDFEVELAGSGTAGTAPAWAALIKACGFSETITPGTSVVYAPISSALPSVTLYFNVDGVLHKITGARGTFDLTMTVKQIPVLKFTFTGIYNAPSDTAQPTPDYSGFQIPKLINTVNTPVFSLLGYSGHAESVAIKLTGDVQYRTLIGLQEVDLVDRKPSGTIVIEAPTITAKDFFTAAVSTTTGALSVTHGTVAGNIIALAAPRVSIGNPAYQDSQGVQMLSLPVVISPSTGNDELTLTLT